MTCTTFLTLAPARRCGVLAARAGAALLGLLLHAAASAQGITVQGSRNDSTGNYLVNQPLRAAHFATELGVSAPLTDGHTTFVDLRLSWVMAMRHESPAAPLLEQTPTLGWSLTVRIDDPLNQGYTLDVDSRLRGVFGAQSNGLVNTTGRVPALRYGFYEAFATEPTALPGADSPAHGTDFFAVDWRRKDEIDLRGSERVGQYHGTRSFHFFLAEVDLAMWLLSDFQGAQAWQQFGTITGVPDMDFANPGPGDPALTDLGQFFRVSATFNATPVPEPGSWALMGAGLLVLLRRRARAALATLAFGGLLAAGTAQAANLDGRTSNVFGNFAVGAFALLDNGNFNEFLTTPTLAYGQEASDAGAVNGIWNDTPVQGSASFASGTHFVFDPMHVVGNGHAETTGTTPYDYVSLAANAISSLRLEFTVPELTAFTLTGSVLAAPGVDVGPRVSQASASVQFTGCVGCAWNASTAPGAFIGSGMLIPGNRYTLRGDASARINGSGQWAFDLVLTPVDEPAAWLLLALGLPALLARRWAAPGRESF